jgi:hypothetical protein
MARSSRRSGCGPESSKLKLLHAAALCAALCGPACAQELTRAAVDQRADRASALFNWNYSAIYGTGYYSIGEESVLVARLPFAYRLRDPAPDQWGLRLTFPLSAALSQFDLHGFDLGHVNTLGLSVLPGIEAEIPMGDGWIVKPFINGGRGWDFRSDTAATIWSTGVSSLYKRALARRWDGAIGVKVTYAGYTARGDKSILGALALGGDLGYRSEKQIGGRPAIFSTQVVLTQYFNRLEFLLPGSPAKKVSKEASLGFTVGASRPFRVLGASVDRFGLAYRQGNGGLKGVELVASFPF